MKKKKMIHVATYQREVFRGVPVKEHLERDVITQGERVVVRLGGTMPYENYPVQINSAEAVRNSIDKLAQKKLLLDASLPTLPVLEQPVYPCVVKAIVRSGGLNVFLVNNQEEFDAAVAQCNRAFIVEPYFEATSEYRLHCTKNEVFFAVKKVKREADDKIITRDNHFNRREFLKPRLWQQIQDTCVKAMQALDLDIACFDVIYNSLGNVHKFAICEANTNPELLANTYDAYLEQINNMVAEKTKALEAKPKPGTISKGKRGQAVVADAGGNLTPVPADVQPVVVEKAAAVEAIVEKQWMDLTNEQKVSVAEMLFENKYKCDGATVTFELAK